jgi:hypothetical protein
MKMERRINLLKYRGSQSSLFTGRPQGEDARKEQKLDELDKTDDKVIIVIPEGTTSLNPSFYLGLLYKSIKNLGINKFEEKFKFEIEDSSPERNQVLRDNLNDGKRNALNSLSNKHSLKHFLEVI